MTEKKARPVAEEAILTSDEIEAVKAQARAEIMADRKKSAQAELLKTEKARLAMEEGLVTGHRMKDEMVSIAIDLAPYVDRILVNSRPFWHGQTYTVARHVADSLREQVYRTWVHENEINGKSRAQFYQTGRSTLITPKGIFHGAAAQ